MVGLVRTGGEGLVVLEEGVLVIGEVVMKSWFVWW